MRCRGRLYGTRIRTSISGESKITSRNSARACRYITFFFWRAACTWARVPILIPAVSPLSSSAPGLHAARAGQPSGDPSESFQPVWNNATQAKAASSRDNPSNTGTSGNAGSKSLANGKNAKGPDPAAKKSDPAPVVTASEPQAQPPTLLKALEAAAEQPRQIPRPVPQLDQPAFIETLTPASPAIDTASATAPAPVSPPADSSPNDSPAPVDPGALVFQLSLNPGEAAKAQSAPAAVDSKEEAPVFLTPEEVSAAQQACAAESGSETKNQNQQQPPQPLPQPLPAGTDGTIASQFGFQSPLSLASHLNVPKPELTAPAPARTIENVSTPDLPMASTVDRIALTIRGSDDQVVRVAINQSGSLVQVNVNAANSDLANQLRISVPELVHHLDKQGYDPRVSMPSSPLSSLPVSIATAHSEFRSGADTNGNTKSNSDLTSQDEPRQQRQRPPHRAWRELASELQDD